MKGVGIDGCRGGWLAFWTGDGAVWECALYPDMASIWADHSDADALFADIPIGLPGHGSRLADTLARRMLGPRGASVFNAPVRTAAWAMADKDKSSAKGRARAKEINRELSGKSLSEQSLNLIPKILEVDSFLAATPEARGKVFEAHPEVCFVLAGKAPMAYPKRTAKGLARRLEIVQRWIPEARAMLCALDGRHPAGAAKGDDALDAAILAVSAHACLGVAGPRPASLPDPPERDETGLPMAIWYHDFN
ncbi:DUF429 domain-containing protein [Pseudodesulfovibrio sp. F-1]|uniref:DUF429 domain-containing protein n=1 Tax=Pseudodesulfovibrio alkaliphilus TaxID=2661613 RepID=A0A7K1KMW4_9BACT|nr:DUF429 domain-containing protein [Pseudodesulfovibrio alkaliphilus]MUM77390.1 DUF429 domain-containing protein [Pseudodesulfovibrio alkaliphilus]